MSHVAETAPTRRDSHKRDYAASRISSAPAQDECSVRQNSRDYTPSYRLGGTYKYDAKCPHP